MNIEIGEYVRTSKGYILEVEHSRTVQGLKFLNVQYGDITKHSKNLIDLIEVGDIIHTKDVLHEDIVYIWSKEYLNTIIQDIKNGIELVEILTHEQYKQNCYKVERS